MIQPIILASESPRRREVLRYFSLPFEQQPHTFDERSVVWKGEPHPYAKQLAEEKAKNVAARNPTRVVVAADTIVVINGQVLTKPENKEDAFRMLRLLAGEMHSVVTGISIAVGSVLLSRSDETKVYMQRLTDAQIGTYLKLNQWHDKAGGYAIQGAGSLLIQRIDGCYYNVIGLPVYPLACLLNQIGIDLWDFVS